ncbi:hypothetical protein [uncultured Intestinimonas sp.]|uniref:hypothetical protein n=1 Tax=uncultured Intestinimonas sp. TaxID=1689265 RepID=UPI0025D1122F|nr:hypothetical protein [uncultured Intestinimonas sp.]
MTDAEVTALAAIVVAVIEAVAAWDRRQTRKDRQRAEKRAARRAEESRLSMDLMSANCALALVTAKKLAGMHTNGDVEEAMEAAKGAQDAYQDFLLSQAAGQVAKV